jgi:hypothetical protein
VYTAHVTCVHPHAQLEMYSLGTPDRERLSGLTAVLHMQQYCGLETSTSDTLQEVASSQSSKQASSNGSPLVAPVW